ncbi:MAG TPA: hypothetical protein VK280_18140, partial [Streptosporangiaceae bacterium]|nr:hypothetical protein [Streptosporangiaceae bacterium]
MSRIFRANGALAHFWGLREDGRARASRWRQRDWAGICSGVDAGGIQLGGGADDEVAAGGHVGPHQQ